MKLYTFPASPNSLRVTAVAYQAGIPLEIVRVDLTKGEHMSPDFIRLNPNHKIPTLADGEFVLWESGAIMHYLAELKPRSKLVPKDRHERMRMHQWMYWNGTNFQPQAQILIWERFVKGLFNLGAPDQDQIRKGEEGFHRYAKVLNDHLRGRNFLVGDTVTLADHMIVSVFVPREQAGFPMGNYGEIQRWMGQMFASKAWKKAFKDTR
ncbi:MAG TPA: glutathione S-transferase family protein [Gammaproteobacteria bacterium]|jgi:glutathione S-transferase